MGWIKRNFGRYGDPDLSLQPEIERRLRRGESPQTIRTWLFAQPGDPGDQQLAWQLAWMNYSGAGEVCIKRRA